MTETKTDRRSDAELIEAVRNGELPAFGELYERHVASAYNLARQLSRSQTEADDLVSVAFAKVLDTLNAGRGPDSAFRAYLLTALRHTAYDKTRRDKKLELSDDVSSVPGAPPEESVPFTDPALVGLEKSLAARAFARLPERWQAVLWHTEIEGQSPAEVAPILGLTPNGVSALAYRAREGLKQAYLQVYLAESTSDRCRATTDRLGAWTRDGLSRLERAQVAAHLDKCDRCRVLAAELADVNSSLRIFIAPLVLGSGTVGYLATAGAAAKIAVGAGVVATGAAAAGTAGGSGAGGAAGASVPRQFLGVGAAGAAVAAALVVGLTAGQGDSQLTAQVVLAQPDQPPAPTPPPGPTSPPPPTGSTTSTPEVVPISLTPGGPTDLPIIVRNTGGATSGFVSVAMALPAGVTAIPTGPARVPGIPPLRLNALGTVFCPGGMESVTCATGSGLRAGESVTLLFRLVAAPGSSGGELTATVDNDTAVDARLTVRISVGPS